MKWILISTKGNPGDSFARFGIVRLIYEVDPDAEFDLINKEDENAFAKRPFDRAVLCGMPLFWSHPEQTCSEIWWWNEIFRGWMTDDPRKFICLGVGDYIGPEGVHNPEMYAEAVREVLAKSFAVSTRNNLFYDDRLISSVCPSLFALDPNPSVYWTGLKLCNLMEEGAHEPQMAPGEARVWKDALQETADELKRRQFQFVAHSKTEIELGKRLGFKPVHFYEDHMDYVELYRNCSEYIGNRLHAAMVAGRAGARVTAIGYDSRVKMLRKVGIGTYTPSEYLKNRWAMPYMIDPYGERLIEKGKKETKELLKRFMEQKL